MNLSLTVPSTHAGQIKQDLRHLLNWPEQNKVTISLDQEGTQLLNDEVNIIDICHNYVAPYMVAH